MSRRFWMVVGAGVCCVVACSEPAGLPGARALSAPTTAARSAQVKQSISGTISLLGGGALGDFRMTPSGRCFFLHQQVLDHFEGDVVGPVTFDENQRAPCDFSHLTGNGPFIAQVTWNGRSGMISGEWTTNCKADASQTIGLSCDGTMNAHGSDGLDGVQFHFKWGPGWYPFPYSGTAFSD